MPELEAGGYTSNSDVSSASELSLSPHSLQTSEDEDDVTVVPTPTPTNAQLRRRSNRKPKRMRGYVIDSEDDVFSTSADECGEDEPLIPCFSDPEQDGNDEPLMYTEIINASSTHTKTTTRDGWIAPSILPSHTLMHASTSSSTTTTLPEYTESDGAGVHPSSSKTSLPEYTDRITSEPRYEKGEKEKGDMEEKENKELEEPSDDMNIAERVLASFTSYESLKRAQLDSEYECAFERLQTEWCYVGGLVRGFRLWLFIRVSLFLTLTLVACRTGCRQHRCIHHLRRLAVQSEPVRAVRRRDKQRVHRARPRM